MATIEKRLQITPTARTHRILTRYSELTGKPRARLISQLLDESTPVLEEMLTHLEAIKKKPSLAPEIAHKYAQDGIQRLKTVQQELPLGRKKLGRPKKPSR
jgi:transposase